MHFSSFPCLLHAPPISSSICLQNLCNKAYKLWIFSLCSLLQSPTSSSFLGPDILISTVRRTEGRICGWLWWEYFSNNGAIRWSHTSLENLECWNQKLARITCHTGNKESRGRKSYLCHRGRFAFTVTNQRSVSTCRSSRTGSGPVTVSNISLSLFMFPRFTCSCIRGLHSCAHPLFTLCFLAYTLFIRFMKRGPGR